MNIISSYFEPLYQDFQLTKTKELYPLSLDIVKRHLRVDNDFTDDDDYIMSLIVSAVTLAENYIGKDIAYTSNELIVEDFSDNCLKVFEGNFLTLDSVKNSSNVSVGTVKRTYKHYDYTYIEWTETIASDPMTFTFHTGFAANTTPDLIKQACLVKIADMYDSQRASLVWSGMTDSKAFENMLNGYMSMRF